jgi:hypothetical protein
MFVDVCGCLFLQTSAGILFFRGDDCCCAPMNMVRKQQSSPQPRGMGIMRVRFSFWWVLLVLSLWAPSFVAAVVRMWRPVWLLF